MWSSAAVSTAGHQRNIVRQVAQQAGCSGRDGSTSANKPQKAGIGITECFDRPFRLPLRVTMVVRYPPIDSQTILAKTCQACPVVGPPTERLVTCISSSVPRSCRFRCWSTPSRARRVGRFARTGQTIASRRTTVFCARRPIRCVGRGGSVGDHQAVYRNRGSVLLALKAEASAC